MCALGAAGWDHANERHPNMHRFHRNPRPGRVFQRYNPVRGAGGILLLQPFYTLRNGTGQIQLRFPFVAFLRESSERIPDTVGLSAFLPCMTRAGVAVPYP